MYSTEFCQSYHLTPNCRPIFRPITLVFGCYIILRASYISSDTPLDKVRSMAMYIINWSLRQAEQLELFVRNRGDCVDARFSWTYCPESATALDRSLVCSLSQRSLSRCQRCWLSVLSDCRDPYLLHRKGGVDQILRTHCRLCSPTANGSICPSGEERGKGRRTWVRVKAAVYPPEQVPALSSGDLVGTACVISPFHARGYLWMFVLP